MADHAVVHVHNELGIGGTEKSIETIVRHQGDRFEPHVCCLDAPGVRGERLREDGYDVTVLSDPVTALAGYLADVDADVVHVHGGFDRGTTAIETARDAGVPAVFKTTHFGLPDDGPAAAAVDRYLFVSRMILLRNLLLNRRPLDGDWHRRHEVLYNPVDLERHAGDGTGAYRREFDVPPDAPLLGKIGRSAPEKWGRITIAAFERIREAVPDARLLLVNTPEKVRRHIAARGLDDAVYYVDGVPLGDIGEFHDSVDLLVHASAIGECCPYVVLEAMAHGTPVVVNSQPMRDNGQIELVEHGKTGYVANTAAAYADAAVELLRDDDLAATMGAEARRRIEETFAADVVADRLERFYAASLAEKGVGDADAEAPPPTDMAEFAATYRRRLRTHYDGAGLGYELERLTWEFVTGPLPAFRPPAYDLLRKVHLFANEYV